MPTTITRTIGKTTAPENRQHATLAAFITWALANYPNLVTSDVILRAEVYKEGGGTNGEYVSSSSLDFTGLSGDATRYIEIVAAAGQGFGENATKLVNVLRYLTSNGVALRWTGAGTYCFINATLPIYLRGLQIDGESIISTAFSGNGEFNAYACVIKSGADSRALNALTRLVNSVLRMTNASATITEPNTSNAAVIGSVIHGAGSGTAFNWGNYASGNIIRNSIVVGFTAITNNSARFNTAQCSNNATDLSSFGFGSANVGSLSLSATFENIGAGTEDYRIKAGASVIGAGVRDQTYTADLDILGQSRSTTTPTIGAFEGASAPPPPPVLLTLPGVQDITSSSVRPKVTITYP